jgi:hypothetical protein
MCEYIYYGHSESFSKKLNKTGSWFTGTYMPYLQIVFFYAVKIRRHQFSSVFVLIFAEKKSVVKLFE